MKDWFGNDYVVSGWTRFVMFWQLFGYQSRRMAAFTVWTANTVARIGEKYNIPVTSNLRESAPDSWVPVADALVELPSVYAGYQLLLTLSHYDEWTKQGFDPAMKVVAAVQSQKYYDSNFRPQE